MKKIVIIKLSDEAEIVLDYLKIKNPKLLQAINKKLGIIKYNPNYGLPISKKKIPNKFKEKYKITNLYWVRLPSFWRLLYSLFTKSKIELIVFLVDISDHKEYNKKMGYKGR